MNKETKNDRKIARSIAFVSSHLDEPIKVTRLAKMVNLSTSYFWAVFKQKTGYAPVDFLIRLRMDQACRLLKRTDLPVNQIAATLGYKDPLYFSRVFKSIVGIAPTFYRAAESDTDTAQEPMVTKNPTATTSVARSL